MSYSAPPSAFYLRLPLFSPWHSHSRVIVHPLPLSPCQHSQPLRLTLVSDPRVSLVLLPTCISRTQRLWYTITITNAFLLTVNADTPACLPACLPTATRLSPAPRYKTPPPQASQPFHQHSSHLPISPPPHPPTSSHFPLCSPLSLAIPIMSAHAEVVDVESGKDSFTKTIADTYKKNYAIIEAAALLALWSILVINEGSIRFISENPSQGITGGRPPKLLGFLGSLSEVVFGLLGLFVGLSAFLLRAHNAGATKLVMLIQTLLGYFVFIVFVFILPIYRAVDKGMFRDDLTVGENRFVIALGILTSFHFCLALQGGQFVFMARLVAAATDTDFLKQRTGATMRAVFWNANLAMSGVWTLITGAFIAAKISGGTLEMPYISPPNVGRLPGMTITAGVLMIALGVMGILIAGAGKGVPKFYFVTVALVYVFAFLNFGMAQFGKLGSPESPPPAGSVALHNGLVFMVVFLGPYFVNIADKEVNDKENML
ncbi:unnamed protein product [Chondrus crispus]|uniref:Uncharacterized protein n=1 Tax=Chondrus crispus TaxID=2769 RepID=R7QHI4_CHOCR|nr:unnamed protein product [Chondrus crispus]CDF37233.1 unnamed protein product [Chondrus crispus]|eukprot:XP_005717052.1 unnamed protein product [Chondrus crispus]